MPREANVQHKSVVKHGMGEVFECLLQVPRRAGGADCSGAAEHHGGAVIPSTDEERKECDSGRDLCLAASLVVYKGRRLLL